MPIMHSLFPESGRPKVDHARCTRCEACVRICPAEVLLRNEDRIHCRQDAPLGCIACGHCAMVCPEACITVTGRGLDPADLRPLPDPDTRASSRQLEALLFSRRSVRRFRQDDVDPSLLDQVVRAAASAPMGIPPWDIGVVCLQGRKRVQEVAAEVIEGYRKFLKIFHPWLLELLRPVIGRARYEQFRHFLLPLAGSYVAARDAGRDTLFWDAPAVLIFHASPYADAVDASIAGTYAMLSAEARGLGSTIIGGAPPLLQRNRDLCLRLGIPAGNRPVFALIVGHPAVRFLRGIQRHFTSSNSLA